MKELREFDSIGNSAPDIYWSNVNKTIHVTAESIFKNFFIKGKGNKPCSK